MIVIVFGLPGSGKSYFAAHLADMIHAGYINSDKLRRTMFATRTYTTDEKLAVYDEMTQQLREAIAQNKNLVIDATFYKKAIRDRFVGEVTPGKNLHFIEVRAEESLVRERLKRPRKDSEADFEVYQKIKQQWEPMEEDHLTLQSTDENLKEMLQKTADYLQL